MSAVVNGSSHDAAHDEEKTLDGTNPGDCVGMNVREGAFVV